MNARGPLALIVPVYNEAENFPALVAEVEQHIPQPFEMHVVYDFDGDTTVPVARAMAADRPWLRVVKNDLGRGVVYAIKAGFQAVASGPALVVMADLSDDLAIVSGIADSNHFQAISVAMIGFQLEGTGAFGDQYSKSQVILEF